MPKTPKRRCQGLSPTSKPRSLRCGSVKLRKNKVLKMLAVMEQQQQVAGEPSSNNCGNENNRPEEFLQSGRTGRRNALPNILSDHALVSSSDLPARIEALTTAETKPNTDGATGDPNSQPGPSTNKS